MYDVKRYDQLLEKVMSDEATLMDWINYKHYWEKLPKFSLSKLQNEVTEEEIRAHKKKNDEMINAGSHIIEILLKMKMEEVIYNDPWLYWMYIEKLYPERMS